MFCYTEQRLIGLLILDVKHVTYKLSYLSVVYCVQGGPNSGLFFTVNNFGSKSRTVYQIVGFFYTKQTVV